MEQRKPFGASPGTIGFLAGVVLTFLTVVTIVPSNSPVATGNPTEVVNNPDAGVNPELGNNPDAGVNPEVGPTIDTGDEGDGGNQTGLECAAGKNGGATETGVAAGEVKLGSTVAESGIGASFLGEARHAMEAVKNKVNRAGGVCGRLLNILYKDDAWDAQQGFTFIKNLVEAEKVFALAVVPSSEGLNQASEAKYFERTKVPVVGSDGMIRTQYTDPYVFPVATSTVSLMHAIAKDAWDRGARKFGIVFEKTYRFGVEGAEAFNAAFERLNHDHEIGGYRNPFQDPQCQAGTNFCAIEANQGSYSAQIANFNQGCIPEDQEDRCDFVALLLEPQTALQWMLDENAKQSTFWAEGSGAAQPLFTYDFGFECGDKCDGLYVWTGYNPPIEQYENQSAVRTFVQDLHSQNGQADEFNQFTEGAYIGMNLVVEALKRTGPNLKRDRFLDTLNSMSLDVGLSKPLKWSSGKNGHLANAYAQAFRVKSLNGFSGWRHAVDYVRDPWLGQDME